MIYVLVILALAFMTLGYIFKRGVLAFSGAGAWLLLCAYSYINAGATFDIYWGLVILSGGLAIISALEPVITKQKGDEEEYDDEETELREAASEADELERKRGLVRRIRGGGRTVKKPPTASLY